VRGPPCHAHWERERHRPGHRWLREDQSRGHRVPQGQEPPQRLLHGHIQAAPRRGACQGRAQGERMCQHPVPDHHTAGRGRYGRTNSSGRTSCSRRLRCRSQCAASRRTSPGARQEPSKEVQTEAKQGFWPQSPNPIQLTLFRAGTRAGGA
jgi:hypothetical protein